MNDPLVVPTGDLADAALAILHQTVDQQIAEHSLRSFYSARLTAQQEGLLTARSRWPSSSTPESLRKRRRPSPSRLNCSGNPAADESQRRADGTQLQGRRKPA